MISFMHMCKRSITMPATETQPLINTLQGINIPKAAPWAVAVPSRRSPSRYLPQTIAHRGYKASWPENSMAAFKSAVGVGAHAIETDVHISKDGVVVLSHDSSLKRCFGVDRKIRDCDWEFLSTLTTLRQPHEKLPRLSDLLEYLVSGPETEKIWVLLDIKMDDDPNALLGAVAKTFTQIPSKVPWDERIVLGCWNATSVKTALSLLPGFPLAHISGSVLYSRHFLPIPNMGFNVLQQFLVGPLGSWLLQDAKKAGRLVFAWTVNEERWMQWCLRKNIPKHPPSSSLSEEEAQNNDDLTAKNTVVIDGVITDDPRLFIEVCNRFEDELDGKIPPAGSLMRSFRGRVGKLLEVVIFNFFGPGFFLYGVSLGYFDLLGRSFLKRLRTQSA